MFHSKGPKDDPWGHPRSILIQSLVASLIFTLFNLWFQLPDTLRNRKRASHIGIAARLRFSCWIIHFYRQKLAFACYQLLLRNRKWYTNMATGHDVTSHENHLYTHSSNVAEVHTRSRWSFNLKRRHNDVTVVCSVPGLWVEARLEVTLFWYKPLCLSHANVD